VSRRAGDRPLAFLTDRAAFVRRFVLAEVLGPRRGLTVRRPAAPMPPRPPAR
jgi:hypothetical protein